MHQHRIAPAQDRTRSNARRAPANHDVTPPGQPLNGPVGTLAAKNGVLVLTGYGLHVRVERGQLVAEDGIGRDRRTEHFSRATCGLKRLVVLGHSGTISFEALRWLHDVDAAFIQIDADATLIAASAPAGLDDARLRRAQVLASLTGTGTAIVRELLRQKLHGQAAALERLAEVPAAADAAASILDSAEQLWVAERPERLRWLEASAAGAYWGVWAGLPLRFATRDASRVPEHWRTLGGRASPLTGSGRKAANPANALLNYLYAMLEAEARIALLILGLDPGMGLLHTDQPGRDSLACDLMEAVRPAVDGYVLELLQTRTFVARDFFETREGVCRVLPPLTQVLAETAPRWARTIAPIAEWVARQLRETAAHVHPITGTRSLDLTQQPASTSKRRARPLPTPLTQANRSVGRSASRRTHGTSAPASTRQPVSVPNRCRICGAPLADGDRQYCDTCLPDRRAELLPAFSASGPQTLARQKTTQSDPAHGASAAEKRGQRVAEQWRAVATWEQEHQEHQGTRDDVSFEHEIRPRLADASLAAMMRATGLSRRYCWLIKTGQKRPHPRHWATLAALARPDPGAG
jgi:CRISPR-associated endonuclease Cas1